MSLLTKYGTYYGQVPRTMGRVFFVAPSASYTVDGRTFSASDNHDGLSPERALRTVSQAITNATASVGDVILLLRGTHTVTSTVAVNKAGLTIWGEVSSDRNVPRRPLSILTSTGTSDELLNITASQTELGYLTLRPTTAYDAVTFQTGDAAIADFYCHDCHFDLYTPTASRRTRGINFACRNSTADGDLGGSVGNHASITSTNRMLNALVERCYFESDGAQGAAVRIATADVLIRDCEFRGTSGTWASVIEVATDTDNSLVDNCIFSTTATISCSIGGSFANVAGGFGVRRCTFNNFSTSNVDSVDAIRGFGAGEIFVVDSYAGSIANGTSSATAISRMTG